MKLRSLALLTIASTLTSLSFAQGGGGFHIGAKAGANIFKIDGTSMKDEFNFGYNVGAFAEIKFKKSGVFNPK